MSAGTGYVYADRPADTEAARLRRLEAASDADTSRLFDVVDVSPGWHCLEVAAGAGSVARALADRVGPGGRVVATDIDLRFLAENSRANLEVRRGDVLADDLEPAAFDLVHARHLLAHLGDHAPVAVGRMVGAVRPGGWLVVEDIDVLPMLLSAPTNAEQHATERTFGAFGCLLRDRGGDPHIGRRLPSLLEEAGLVDVRVDARLRYIRSADEDGQVALATLTSLRPMLIDAGASEDDVDLVLSVLSRPDHRGFSPLQVAAWGRKPGVAQRPHCV